MKDTFGIDFSEASTWRGLVWFISACGLALDPEEQNTIIMFGMALSGLIGMCWKRYKSHV